MGKAQRAKGARFERTIARWYSKVVGREVRRQTDEPQGGNLGDIRVSLSNWVTLVTQAKHQKSPSPWRAMQEAEEAAATHSRSSGDDVRQYYIPVACIRRHGGEDLVCLRPVDFGRMVRAIMKQDHRPLQPHTWSDV